jgi:hypothetical protein
MADAPAAKISDDPEVPVDDALEQATGLDPEPVVIVPSIDVEVPEADALDQAIPAYLDDEGDDRR